MSTSFHIDRIDHLVLTVENIEETSDFYTRILGMEVITFGAGRTALRFGAHKINLHLRGHKFEPKAAHPTPGSADICLITTSPIEDVNAYLEAHHIAIVEGPVRRTGALGELESIYIRDPDGNLIEIAKLLPVQAQTST